jgi:predicted nucleic acid-binding protein
MIFLDTNVVSDWFTKKPSHSVSEWMNGQEHTALFLSVIVLAELYFGAYLVQEDRRREHLLQSIARIRDDYAGRTLGFSEVAAERYGQITAMRQSIGRQMETKDAVIAAICLVHGATLATRNMKDFEGLGLKLVNPFEAGA